MKKIPYYNGEPGIVPEEDFTPIAAQRWNEKCLTERRPRKQIDVVDLAFRTTSAEIIGMQISGRKRGRHA